MDEQFFFDSEDIFRNLNPQQVEAVNCLNGPLLVMAGAGSGKTRVLTCRIANLIAQGISPWNILAITFTNKAANEMKSRAENLIGLPARQVMLSTFHSFCARLLRREIEITGKFTKNFAIYDTSDSKTLVKQCVADLRFDEQIFALAHGKISALKNELVDVEMFKEHVLSSGDVYARNLAMIYELYQKKLQQNNALDFDDLIFSTVKIFREYPEVLDRCQERFQYISVDEYQDTNVAQYVLTKMLAAKYRNICVVGDADQSIYGWRGADMRNIMNFKDDYPDARVILLEQNYRSTKTILRAANAVIQNNFDRIPKNLWTVNENGEKIKFVLCQDDMQEASLVSNEIIRLVEDENFSYNDIAILYRTNAQSRLFEENFMQKEIPYIIVGGLKFYDRKEIKDIVAYLHVIANPQDNVHLQRIINTPRRGLGITNINRLMEFSAETGLSVLDIIANPGTLFQVEGLTQRFRAGVKNFAAMMISFMESANDLPVDKLIEVVLNESGYLKMLNELKATAENEAVSREENLGAFLNSAKDFVELNPEGTLEDFLNHVALITDMDSIDDNDSRVRLMTVHSAKGLEFPAVFVVGMEDGLFPHANALYKSDQLEEERRACYVALTRAEKKLYVTAAMKRMFFGKIRDQKISRFVDEIPSDCMNQYGVTSPAAQKKISTSSYRAPTAHRPASVKKSAKTHSKANIKWSVGDRVSHKLWGTGTIVDVTSGGTIVTVQFTNPEVGLKKLAAAVAPITKI